MSNFLNVTSAAFSVSVVLFNLILAFILSWFVGWIYVRTHRGLSYSQSFVFSLVLVAVITASIIMAIQSSIVAALGLLGVFSFIRFRTILKETKDVVYIFLALAIGLSVGISSYTIAFAATLICAAVILILTKYNFAAGANSKYIVNLVTAGLLNDERLKEILSGHTKSHNILHARLIGDNEYEYTIAVETKSGINDLIGKINSQSYIRRLDVISCKDTVEY